MKLARIVVLSAADSGFFSLLIEMLTSLSALASIPGSTMPQYDVGIFDLGLSEADCAWLAQRNCSIAVPRPHLGFGSEGDRLRLAYLVRPFLPDYFPDYDVYLWIDSDVWLQSLDSLVAMIEGASARGMSIAHERERAYRHQSWLLAWTTKHFLLGYGVLRGAWLLSRPHLNAGIFAIHRDAPHWKAWANRYADAMRRTGKITPHDQFALNQAIYQDRLDTMVLPPTANWICDRGAPMWNTERQALCVPYAPFAVISAVHLAGPGKRTVYAIKQTRGPAFQAVLRYGVSPSRTHAAVAQASA